MPIDFVSLVQTLGIGLAAFAFIVYMYQQERNINRDNEKENRVLIAQAFTLFEKVNENLKNNNKVVEANTRAIERLCGKEQIP